MTTKQPASPPMTLGNMRELGLALILGFHFNAEARAAGGCRSGVLGHAYDFIEIPRSPRAGEPWTVSLAVDADKKAVTIDDTSMPIMSDASENIIAFRSDPAADPGQGRRRYSLAQGITPMDALTLFGLVAVTAMLIFYALEDRSPWFILVFAGACVLASAYGFLQGAWPFGIVEFIGRVLQYAVGEIGPRDGGLVQRRCNQRWPLCAAGGAYRQPNFARCIYFVRARPQSDKPSINFASVVSAKGNSPRSS